MHPTDEKFPIIKLGIVDDEVILTDALKCMFETANDFKVAFCLNNGTDLIVELCRRNVDIVLMDLKLPDISGIDLLKKVKQRYPGKKVIIMSAMDDKNTILKCMELGAGCYLTKGMNYEVYRRAILDVYKTGHYFTHLVSLAMKEDLVQTRKRDPVYGRTGILFSEKEKILMRLICSNKNNKEIATEINISQNSVETNKKRLYEKAGCENIKELVIFAFKNRIVDPDLD